MKVRNTPSSCAGVVSSSAPSRMTAPENSVVSLGLTTFLDDVSRCRSPTFTASWFGNELPEPVHYSAATSLQQTWNNYSNWTVANLSAGLSRASAR